jgi:acetyl-CoA synthase
MSKIIATAAIRGAHQIVNQAEADLQKAIEKAGKEAKVAYPNTAYYLPIIFLFLGQKVEKVGDLEYSLQEAKKLLRDIPSDRLWLPYLGDTLDSGVATLIAEEIIESLKYVIGPNPVEGIWLGFTGDNILRLQGIKLVDGRMPGFVALIGCTEKNEDAVKLIRGFQERSILVFIAGHTNGKSIAEQLAEEGIEMNWDSFLVPYGKEITAAIHAANFAARAAMTFGGVEPGDMKAAREILLYNKERVHAFAMALGSDDGVEDGQLITDEKYATAAGVINFGFPVISDVNLPQILPSGICTYEHVVSGIKLDEIISRAIELRGLTIKLEEIPIPVPYGAGFEGERVRKENMFVQFGGKYTDAFELLRMAPMDDVEDGKVEVRRV